MQMHWIPLPLPGVVAGEWQSIANERRQPSVVRVYCAPATRTSVELRLVLDDLRELDELQRGGRGRVRAVRLSGVSVCSLELCQLWTVHAARLARQDVKSEEGGLPESVLVARFCTCCTAPSERAVAADGAKGVGQPRQQILPLVPEALRK